MKKGKLKWIIIAIVGIILITAGVLTFLYFTTDIFKSNQQLFFKYIAQNDKILETLQKNSNEEQADKLLKQSKYTTEAEVNFQLTSSDEQIANQAIPARNFSINYTAKTDGLNQKQSSEATIKYLAKDLFTAKYIRNDDLYAITSDEVLNKYLAFENSNIQEFVKKFGITDVTEIPNKIESLDWGTVINFTQQEEEIVLQRMIAVITNKVSQEQYTKKKNMTISVNNKEMIANEYALTLTKQELNEIIYEILDNFENDDTILNMILNKVKIVNAEANTNEIKEVLQTMKQEIQNGEDGELIIKIAVYESEGSLVKTAVIVSDGSQIVMNITEDGKIIIAFGYNYTNDTTNNNSNTTGYQIKSIEIANKTVGTQTEREYIVTLENENDVIKIAMQNKTNNNLENGTLEKQTIINLDLSNITYFTIKCTSKDTLVTDLAVEELTSQNSVKINDFTSEYTVQLIQSIINRLTTLFNQKMQVVMEAQQEENKINQETSQGTTNNTNTNQIAQ